MAEFSSELRAEIARQFSAHTPVLGEGDQVATFKCASGSLEVIAEADGTPAVTIYLFDMTHRHYGSSHRAGVGRRDGCEIFRR